MKKIKFWTIAFLLCPIGAFAWWIPSDTLWYGEIENGIPIRMFVVPKNTPVIGTVIVAHGCSGISDHHMRVGKQFSEMGYTSVLVDSWGYRRLPTGTGPTSVCQTNVVDGPERLEEIYKAVSWIKKQPWHTGKILLIGHSHGGKVALAAMKNGPEKGIDKAVAVYPYCYPNDHTEPKIPIQVHIGTDDNWTPAYRCRGIFTSWFKTYKYGEYYEYPDTHHAFDFENVDREVYGIGQGGVVAKRRMKYNKESTELAYSRIYKFFKE